MRQCGVMPRVQEGKESLSRSEGVGSVPKRVKASWVLKGFNWGSALMCIGNKCVRDVGRGIVVRRCRAGRGGEGGLFVEQASEGT